MRGREDGDEEEVKKVAMRHECVAVVLRVRGCVCLLWVR